MSQPPRRDLIEQEILHLISEQPTDVAGRLAKRFGITRQAAAVHLKRLADRGAILAEGETRNRQYRLPVMADVIREFPADGSVVEDRVWSDFVVPALDSTSQGARDICHYGLTEMVNNAIDHSGSSTMHIRVRRTAAQADLEVRDHGVGIFRKIREAYHLEDDRHAIFELVKGKLTTDPARHTGEGIFFTSRMFDEFSILSGSLFLWHKREHDDWLIEAREAIVGTRVRLSIARDSTHTTNEVFERYTSEQDDFAFSRTHVVVDLLRSEGESLVSRSQARRLLARLDKFREIVLDFRGVETIGPAFADEIFRVFARSHPGTRLTTVRASRDVARMIRRALAQDAPEQPS